MSWRALARRVALLGQQWSRRWRAVQPGRVSDAWLHDFEVASGKQRDR
jgi:hypothetical protein